MLVELNPEHPEPRKIKRACDALQSGEVIAYPKLSSGVDPMTGAPKPVDERILRDVGLRLLPPKA